MHRQNRTAPNVSALAVIALMLCQSPAYAAIVTYAQSGLNFKINNDDPFHATIEFLNSSTPYISTTSKDVGFYENPNSFFPHAVTTVDTVLSPLPNPTPFPPPPQTKTVTTTTTTYINANISAEITVDALSNGIQTVDTGPTVLTPVSFDKAVFSPPLVIFSLPVNLVVKDSITAREDKVVQVFENDVLVQPAVTTTRIYSETLTLPAGLRSLSSSVQIPSSLDPRGFPTSVTLSQDIGAIFYFNMSFRSDLRNKDFAGQGSIVIDKDGIITIATATPLPPGLGFMGFGLAYLLAIGRQNKGTQKHILA